jgi:gluconokinase
LKKSFESSHEIESFIDEALAVKEGSEGLVFLPYIFGERAPVWDADARGIYFGVSAVHTIAHFMRAAMEGISFALYDILRSVEEVNGPARDIYASGGFIKSGKWVGLLADVLGKKLHVMHAEDSSAAGAAILGLRTLGIIKDFKQAATFFKELEIYEPDMEAHRVYMRNYQVYSNLYDKFRELKS